MINIKLKRFKKYFKGGDADIFGHNKKLKQELKNELEVLEEQEELGDTSVDQMVVSVGATYISASFPAFHRQNAAYANQSKPLWL